MRTLLRIPVCHGGPAARAGAARGRAGHARRRLTRRPTTRRRSRSARRSSRTTPTRRRPRSRTPTATRSARTRSTSARAYINVTGNISAPARLPHHAGHRARDAAPAARSNGSYTFRLKYAYAQFNLDDWMPQGLVGPPRHAADAVGRLRGEHLPLPLPGHDLRGPRGLPDLLGRRRRRSAPTFPQNYGDVHVGVYNGESYNAAGGQRPEGVPDPRHAPAAADGAPSCAACALTGVLRQRPLRQGRRTRRALVGAVTFEHPYVNAGVDYLDDRRTRRSRTQAARSTARAARPG